jgi:hypothetical protein
VTRVKITKSPFIPLALSLFSKKLCSASPFHYDEKKERSTKVQEDAHDENIRELSWEEYTDGSYGGHDYQLGCALGSRKESVDDGERYLPPQMQARRFSAKND